MSGSWINLSIPFSTAPFTKTSKWGEFVNLCFRSQACHHPLLAAAVSRLAREELCAKVYSIDIKIDLGYKRYKL